VGLLQAFDSLISFLPKKPPIQFSPNLRTTRLKILMVRDRRCKLLPADKFMGSPVKVLNCWQTFSLLAILLQNTWLEKCNHSNMKFKQKAKYSKNIEKYPSWIARSTKIILFLDMLKISKFILFSKKFLCEGKWSIFWIIQQRPDKTCYARMMRILMLYWLWSHKL
jgi:hypothetical protein